MKISQKNIIREFERLRDAVNDAMSEFEEAIEAMEDAAEEEPLSFPIISFAELCRRIDNGEITPQVGDRFLTPHADIGKIDWTVIGIGSDGQRRIKGDKYRPTVTLQMTHCLEEYRWFSKPSKAYPWGRNSWESSDIREWLNGAFLDGFSDDDKNALVFVRKETYHSDVDGGEKYDTVDKVFLLSASELGFTGTYIKDEGEVYPYYDGHPENRCKTDIESGDESFWWVRSPAPSYANSVRYVYTDGSLYSNYANHGRGCAAACAI